MELFELTIHELSRHLKAREISATEILNAVFHRIEEVEGRSTPISPS